VIEKIACIGAVVEKEGMSSGGKGTTPIRDELLNKPTPTLS